MRLFNWLRDNAETAVAVAVALLLLVLLVGSLIGNKGNKKTEVKKAETVTEQTRVKKKTKVKVTKRPDGTSIVETTRTDDRTDTVQTHTEVTKTVTEPKAKNTISALFGLDTAKGAQQVYGAQYSRELVGPASVGVWAVSNGTVGVSLGVSF